MVKRNTLFFFLFIYNFGHMPLGELANQIRHWKVCVAKNHVSVRWVKRSIPVLVSFMFVVFSLLSINFFSFACFCLPFFLFDKKINTTWMDMEIRRKKKEVSTDYWAKQHQATKHFQTVKEMVVFFFFNTFEQYTRLGYRIIKILILHFW